MSVKTISPAELAQVRQHDSGIELIDVRTPAEFREAHIEFARNVPLDRLDPAHVMQSRTHVGQPLYVICQAGGRGKTACERFHQAGFTDVINVEGGTKACEQSGVSIVRGRKEISLERQVRIAAGTLVLVGVVLAWLIHPGFVGLSAFVGAGLVFAGVTDTCGMGMLLARMPWNK